MKTALWIGVFFFVLALGTGYLLQNKRAPWTTPPPESVLVTEGQTIPLYFYRLADDTDENGNTLCTKKGLVRVARKLPEGHTLEDRIRLLLKGELTSEERAQGISTEFPLAGFSLESVTIQNRKATLTFSDVLSKTTGGACRTALLWYQIEQTALAYPDIRDVEFKPDTLFQP